MAEFRLFPYLKWRNDKSTLLSGSSYKKYYDQNAHYFSLYPWFGKYNDISDDYAMIKAVIVLKAIVNKVSIENDVELYQEADLSKAVNVNAIHAHLPYMKNDKPFKIYVPFFTEIYNRHYATGLSTLLKAPYNTLKDEFQNESVNPFDYYGIGLFDSYFTNLIKIGESEDHNLAGFYSIEFETVYIIDSQGCLEEKMPLFDSQLEVKRKDHMFDRLSALLAFYFGNDKEGFIDSLYNLHFISFPTYSFILKKENIRDERIEKHLNGKAN